MDSLKLVSLLLICLTVADCTIENQNFQYNLVNQIDTPTCNISRLSQETRLKLLDASAKVPSGLLDSNVFDFGNFDECYNIFEHLDNEDIYGKYCLGTMQFDQLPEILNHTSNSRRKRMVGGYSIPGYHFGYCLPNSCTTNDFTARHPIMEFSETFCYSQAKPQKYDSGDIIALMVFGVFGALLVSSTSYGVYLYYTNQKPRHPILLCFSIIENGRKIFKTSSTGDQLTCIHGMKALSMMWVMYGHEYSSTLLYSGVDNYKSLLEFADQKENMYILSAQLSVDSFFAIGGLLSVYVYLKSLEQGKEFNLVIYYLHRFIRLTPALAATVLFNATLIRHLGEAPIWGAVWEFSQPCQKYWWSTLLYIQNFVNISHFCNSPTWYLSADMQYYILSPLILYPLSRWPKTGLCILMFCTILGCIVPFTITYVLDLPVSTLTKEKEKLGIFSIYFYYQSYARFGPYVIGMIFGYVLYKLKRTENCKKVLKRNEILAFAGVWILILWAVIACTYGGADVVLGLPSKLSRAFFNGFNRNAWAVLVSLVIVLCSLGYGGPINKFLSIGAFQFLSKISYSMYLLHYSVIGVRMMRKKTLFHYSWYDVMNGFWIDFVTIIFFSILLCVTFESPIIIIEKYIFGKHKKTDKTSKNNSI